MIWLTIDKNDQHGETFQGAQDLIINEDDHGNLIGNVHMGSALRYKDMGEWHIRDDENGTPRPMSYLWARNLWYIIFYILTPRVQCKNPYQLNMADGKANLATIYSLYGEKGRATDFTGKNSEHEETAYSSINYLDFLTETEQADYLRAQRIIDSEVQFDVVATPRSKGAKPSFYENEIDFSDDHAYQKRHVLLTKAPQDELPAMPYMTYTHTKETRFQGRPWTKKEMTSDILRRQAHPFPNNQIESAFKREQKAERKLLAS